MAGVDSPLSCAAARWRASPTCRHMKWPPPSVEVYAMVVSSRRYRPLSEARRRDQEEDGEKRHTGVRTSVVPASSRRAASASASVAAQLPAPAPAAASDAGEPLGVAQSVAAASAAAGSWGSCGRTVWRSACRACCLRSCRQASGACGARRCGAGLARRRASAGQRVSSACACSGLRTAATVETTPEGDTSCRSIRGRGGRQREGGDGWGDGGWRRVGGACRPVRRDQAAHTRDVGGLCGKGSARTVREGACRPQGLLHVAPHTVLWFSRLPCSLSPSRACLTCCLTPGSSRSSLSPSLVCLHQSHASLTRVLRTACLKPVSRQSHGPLA